MLTEVGISPEIIKLINTKSFGNSVSIASDSTLEPKVLLYANMRVTLDGIVAIDQRLNEVAQ